MQEPCAGIDVGSTLAKLALRDAQGVVHTETFPSASLDAVAERLADHSVERVGLTGMGAEGFARNLQLRHWQFSEFEAWAAGARELRAHSGDDTSFLLVSVGTGTSAVLVGRDDARRVGGCALGGGTILGLGRRLCGARDFDSMMRLAGQGDRTSVDLTIGDLHSGGELPLPAQATAACFGKLAQEDRAEDLAHAVVGLVGENVGLLCAGLAQQYAVETVVFGGSTLQNNPVLVLLLRLVCQALGRTPQFPDEGPYLGALGALARVRVVEP